ncbi:alpha/beta hydrolase [Blattabacterium cuenoti]|uniref:alpha/beta hydrolase n=1 Tax=Blattabacterium cuenoti TaxID=1653831 RepID=UPI00163C96C5|nr:phospholipase [Blattabacterium cuenoti]
MFIEKDCSINYLVKKPSSCILNDKKLPILFIMHGYGSNEKDLFFLNKEIPKNFFIVSMQGIYSMDSTTNYSNNNGKYYWYDIDFSDKEKTKIIDIIQVRNTIKKIYIFIDEIFNKYKLKTTNIWLCGFSQGAILSYAIALNYSSKIKKVIVLSGCIEKKMLNKNIEKNNDLEFFISHGKNDTIIPVSFAKKSLEILKNYSFNFSYKEYDSGHTLCDKNYNDLINWIYKKSN